MITKRPICLIMQINPGSKKLTFFRIEFKISFINYETTLKWFLISSSMEFRQTEYFVANHLQ